MRRLALLLACTVAACSKHHDAAPAPVHTAPWRATPAPSAAPRASQIVKYELVPQGTARFELKAHDGAPRGELRVARGELSVDLLDLSRTRGTVEMDLASVAMSGEDDAGTDVQASQQAEGWLDVGADRPEATRERLRWAKFTIRSIERATADAASEGRVVKKGALPPLGGEAADAAADTREVREVDLSATGDLELHGFRVERTIALRALFEYAAPAVASAVPQRIVIQTRAPFVVSLAVHGILPRDSAGVVLAEGMKLLGTKVGKDARVSLDLAAVPKMR